MANSSNVTKRQLPDGVDRPLTYEELDINFDELKSVIDAYNAHVASLTGHSSNQITYDNTVSGLAATKVKTALDELDSNNESTQSQLDTHEASSTAHPAANITYVNTTSGLAANTVQGALDEIDGNLDSHIASGTAHASSNITYSNTLSGLTATNVKAAVDELDANIEATQAQLDDHEGSSSAHGASSITYDNATSGLTATDTQAAIDEVEGRVDTNETDIGNLQTAQSGKVDTDSEASLLNIAKEESTTATTGSLDLDVSTATTFVVDVIGTIDITLSGTTANKTHSVYVEATNSGGSLSWTTPVTWDTGTEPVLGAAFSLYYLVFVNGTWYGREFVSG